MHRVLINRRLVVADASRSEALTTGYDQDELEAAYGAVSVQRDTSTVSHEKYERLQADAAADALGCDRVLLSRGDGEQTLLVSNRGEAGWDIPGGAREPGKVPEETARREVSEEVISPSISVMHSRRSTGDPSPSRATVLSGASMIPAFVGSGARVLAGRATEVFGPIGFLPWAGIGLSILGTAVWFLTSPVRTHAESETSQHADGATPH